MMKKYNKPEIVTLALETVDVIETSGETLAASAVSEKYDGNVTVQTIHKQITSMDNTWSW